MVFTMYNTVYTQHSMDGALLAIGALQLVLTKKVCVMCVYNVCNVYI